MATIASIIVGVAIALGGFMFLLAQLGGGPFDLLAPTTSDDQEQSLEAELITTLPDGVEPTTLAGGPKGGAYLIDEGGGSVWRVNTGTGKVFEIDPARRPASRIGRRHREARTARGRRGGDRHRR